MEFLHSKEPVLYENALREMEARVDAISSGEAGEAIWFLEHPPLYTAGTSAKESDLLNAQFPVHKTGRGGEYTYHGPGQRVAYVMIDLDKRGKKDLHAYVTFLEEWLIKALETFDVTAERREGRIGLWVDMAQYGGAAGEEAKIAAIGVRVRRWVTFHGVALNIAPDLEHFSGIVPCGISEHGVTSLQNILKENCPTMDDIDKALKQTWYRINQED